MRGVATVDQLETLYLVTKKPLRLERKARLKYPGTSAGSLITPVAVPAHASLWQETGE